MTDTSDVSPNLGLPFYQTKLNEFEVQHNEALLMLDALVMLAVIERDLSAPPSSPAIGDRYLVKPTGTGDFAGNDDRIAQYDTGGWNFYAPQKGWTCYVQDEEVLLAWNGTAWAAALDVLGGISEIQNLSLLGVGTTADSTNPMSAKLNNVLWAAKTVAEGGDGTLRYKLSKENAAATLSFLFQDDYSGRAEIGLTGDDDFHFKTSPDGSAWVDALSLDKTTGAARLNSALFLAGDIAPTQITADQNDYNPTGLSGASVLRLSTDASRNLTGLAGGADGRVAAIVNVGSNALVLKDASSSSSAANRFAFGVDVTLAAGQSAVLWYDATDSRWKLLAGPQAASGGAGRAMLTANRTYYVRTDGSDSNDGLANSSGGAFLTIQKAVDVVAALDLSTYNVTIQVGAGTYTGATALKTLVGAGNVTISGDVTTPSNCLVSVTSANRAFTADGARGNWFIQGFKITTSGSGQDALRVVNGARLQFGSIEFGAVASGFYHILVRGPGSAVIASGNYSISGGGSRHLAAQGMGHIDVSGRTVALSGTPAFASYFAEAIDGAGIYIYSMTFTGSATGARYNAAGNAWIETFGGGASYLPGNAAGSTATGGQYN